MLQIASLPVCVVVFGMTGCPACSSYIPRFRTVAAKYARCVPSAVLDASVYNAVADDLRVGQTPTTLVLRYGRPSSRPLVGDASKHDIEQVFARAMRGLECTL